MAADQTARAPAGPAGPEAAPAMPEAGPGTVLANRDFVKLWAGESVSLIGTQVTQFTMPLVAILSLHASALQVGVLNALKFAPVVVIALLAGVWLDRRKRRPVLICCALANAVLIALVPLASVTGLLSIGLLYVVVTLSGSLSVIFDVGALAYVPFLVERRHLAESNARLQASFGVAGFAGPGLAGLLVGLITAPVTLSVDAVSYLFSAAGLISIRKPEPEPAAPADRPSVRRSINEGLQAVYGRPLLRVLLAQSATLNIGFGAVSTIFTVYGIRVLRLSPFELGVAVGALAVGAVLGSLVATRLRNAIGLGHAMAVAVAGVSASPGLLLIPHHRGGLTMVLLMGGWLGHGLGIAIWNTNTITLRQALTPMRLLARMNASYRMLLFGALPVGALAAGALGSAVGLRHALVIAVIALATPLLWIAFSPVFRLREMPLGPLSDRIDDDSPPPASTRSPSAPALRDETDKTDD